MLYYDNEVERSEFISGFCTIVSPEWWHLIVIYLSSWGRCQCLIVLLHLVAPYNRRCLQPYCEIGLFHFLFTFVCEVLKNPNLAHVVGFMLRFRLKFQIQFRWNRYFSTRIVYIHGKFRSVERWWFSAQLVPILGFSLSKIHLILWGSHFGNEGQAT